jgi:hypothetical protein
MYSEVIGFDKEDDPFSLTLYLHKYIVGRVTPPARPDEPSPDVAPIHDRQMVILERADWSEWLEKIGNEADLLRALPAGSLEVEQVRP